MKPIAYLQSIRGRMTLANGTLVLVLLGMTLLATVQFREIARLVSVVSDGSEVLMRLSHALDARVPLLESYQKGYSEGSDEGARARVLALSMDVAKHVDKAISLAGTNEEAGALRDARTKLREASGALAGLAALPEDEREVALIETEEKLSDTLESLATAKLLANRGMEQRLESVKREITRPVRMFWGASLLGIAIAMVVSTFLRKRVSTPVALLSQAVSELSRGNLAHIEARGDDELGRLGRGFNEMSQTIVERTRSLRLVLDNVGDGLITADPHGVLTGEPSLRALSWFGAPSDRGRVWDYLFVGDDKLAAQFTLGYGQLVEGILPFELCAYQMPSEFTRGEHIYALSYRPVMSGEVLERILIIVSDVTEQRLTAKKEREQRDVYSLASLALADPEAFTDFCTDVDKRLARALTGEQVMFDLHTIKGNAGVMGCEHFAAHVHELEDRMLEDGFSKAPVEALKRHWETLGETVERAVGRSAKEALVVPRKEYDRLLRLMQTSGRADDAFVLAQSWSMHRVGSSLSRLAKTAVRYAERQGKLVDVSIEGGELSVKKGMLDEFWGCLIHLVKNAVAHGIETSDTRQEAGKSAQGSIALAARVAHGELLVTVGDDGRGIDWPALEAKAKNGERGVALLSGGSGVSTSGEADDLSGRGVGVGAVAKVVEELGGQLSIDSALGAGTRFTIKLPVANDAYVPSTTVAPPPALRGAKS